MKGNDFMSYYANMTGHIKFQNPITEEMIKYVKQELGQPYDIDVNTLILENTIDLYCYSKYDEDILDALEKISDRYPIAEGELNYRGEDESLWRHIYTENRWTEQTGRIVYEE